MEENNRIIPWVVKYKPKAFEEIIFHKTIIDIIKNSLDNLPHLIFYGPNGVGKSSLIKIITNSIFSTETFKQNVLFLSASEQRGIGVVRQEIKNFAKQSVYLNEGSFKIVVLDEVDSMSFDAQSALRRIMETYSKTTRFCFICNSINRISNPIVSRCVKFLFKPIPSIEINNRLNYIAVKENLSDNKKQFIEKISNISKGDLRKAINLFEILSLSDNDKNILEFDLDYLIGTIKPELINNLINSIEEKNFSEMKNNISNIFFEGYSSKEILNSLYFYILNSETLSEHKKKLLIKHLVDIDYITTIGGDQNLNIIKFGTLSMDII
jgi:replication factor C subunit 2/4